MQMSATEFLEWQTWYRMHPFGEEVQQQQLATIEAMLATRDGKSHKVDEYMPHVDEVREQTAAEQIAILGSLLGG